MIDNYVLSMNDNINMQYCPCQCCHSLTVHSYVQHKHVYIHDNMLVLSMFKLSFIDNYKHGQYIAGSMNDNVHPCLSCHGLHVHPCLSCHSLTLHVLSMFTVVIHRHCYVLSMFKLSGQ